MAEGSIVSDTGETPNGKSQALVARLTPDKFRELLVSQGLATAKDIDGAIHSAGGHTGRLDELLLERQIITRGDVLEVMSMADSGIPDIRMVHELPEWDVVLNDKGGNLGKDLQRREDVVALASRRDLAEDRKRIFIVAPRSLRGSKALTTLISRASREKYQLRAVLYTDSPQLIQTIYSTWDHAQQSRQSTDPANDAKHHVRFDHIGLDAFHKGASDIHVENREGKCLIKFRIDGDLHIQDDTLTSAEAEDWMRSVVNTLADRNSIRDGYNPRQLKDAVIERNYDVGKIRFRFNNLPVEPNGFDVTIRVIPLMPSHSKLKSFYELGYSRDQSDSIDRMLSFSGGIILFIGSTGHGKSTSWANSVQAHLKRKPYKKHRTIEEPIERIMAGVSQTQATRDAEGNSNFLDILRSFVRSDPDLIGIGETRDDQTAKLLLDAARAGGLCLSTLHADSSLLGFDRLYGMGVTKRDLAMPGLIRGFIYQRLVKRLCDTCKVPASYVADQVIGTNDDVYLPVIRRLQRWAEANELNGPHLDGIFFRREGRFVRELGICPQCEKRGEAGRGNSGRTPCAEIMEPTVAIMKAIQHDDPAELYEAWRATINHGDPGVMTGRTAFEHGLWKMQMGWVSPLAVEEEFSLIDTPVLG